MMQINMRNTESAVLLIEFYLFGSRRCQLFLDFCIVVRNFLCTVQHSVTSLKQQELFSPDIPFNDARMIDFLWFKAVVKTLVQPPTGPLLLAALGVVLLRRAPRAGRALAAAGVAALLVLSMPVVAEFLVSLVDRSVPFDPQSAKG